MNPRGKPSTGWIGLAALLAALGMVRTAVAQPGIVQDALDIELDIPAQDAPAVIVAPQPPQNVFVLDERNFNSWAFGKPDTSDAIRAGVVSTLTLQLAEVERCCTLTIAQKEKLRLAGQGDIEQFFNRVEEKRRLYCDQPIDQQKVGQVHAEIVPLQTILASGLFGDGSLFARVLRSTLGTEQLESYEQQLAERRAYRYQARVEQEVATLTRTMGLPAEQCRRLSDLIVAETRPPRAFGRYDHFRWTSQAERYVREVRVQAPGAERIVNKALGNNRILGLIARMFPKTRIIHAIRDPRDVATSCIMGGFVKQVHPYATRVQWAASAWEQSMRLMDHWKKTLNVPILDVYYEKLVTQPETEFPRIIEFLGLEWDDACREFFKSRRTVRTLSYDQVNRPLYTTSINRNLNYSKHLEWVAFPTYMPV